jgi:hypothetical protein
MRRVSFRWFFPIFHFVMDLILIFALLFERQKELRREKRPWTVRPGDSIVTPLALPQQSEAVDFDPRLIQRGLKSPLALLWTSEPAAIVVLSWKMPSADLQRILWRSTEWWWIGIYEAICVMIWFLMGSIADRGDQAVYRWCFGLVLIRTLALAVLGSPIWRLGQIVQALFWLGATIYSVAAMIWGLARRIRST